MKILSILISTVICMLSFNLNAEPKMIRLEEALEQSSLNIKLDDSLNGHIDGKMCNKCKTIRVAITPETIAINKKDVVPLIEARKRSGKSALVIFDPKTMKVKSIKW